MQCKQATAYELRASTVQHEPSSASSDFASLFLFSPSSLHPSSRFILTIQIISCDNVAILTLVVDRYTLETSTVLLHLCHHGVPTILSLVFIPTFPAVVASWRSRRITRSTRRGARPAPPGRQEIAVVDGPGSEGQRDRNRSPASSRGVCDPRGPSPVFAAWYK